MEIRRPKEISRQKVTCFYSEWPLFYQVSYGTAEKVREETNALVSHKERVHVCSSDAQAEPGSEYTRKHQVFILQNEIFKMMP